MNEKMMIFLLYFGAVFFYEQEEILIKINKAFSRFLHSEKTMIFLDIFLLILFYPLYWVSWKIMQKDKMLGDSFIQVFHYILYFVFSPIYLFLLIWQKMEIRFVSYRVSVGILMFLFFLFVSIIV